MTSAADRSASYDGGAPLVVVALAVGLGLVMVTALCAGRLALPPGTVLGIVLSRIVPVDPSWSELQERIVLLVRLPRVLLTAICGAALAAAGAAMQGVLRNPLVSPHILGVSSGASFGGAVAILLGLSGWFLIGSAFLAGSAALLLVGAIARVDGRSGTITVVLTGIIVAALFSALVSLTQFVAEPDSSLPAIVFWLMGSFATASWRQLAAAAPVLALALMLVLGLRFRINVLSLGEDDARALGLPVERDRWLVFLAVALMEATVVAFAGVIGWVGLVVPHAARMVAGEDHRLLIPASALLGASYLVLVDTIARTAVAAEIPLGVLTAIVGAPVFALLLRQRQRRELAA